MPNKRKAQNLTANLACPDFKLSKISIAEALWQLPGMILPLLDPIPD